MAKFLRFVLLTVLYACALKDLTIGLAHKRGGKGNGMYQLIIGNKGNLQVDLEKRRVREARPSTNIIVV